MQQTVSRHAANDSCELEEHVPKLDWRELKAL